MSARADVTRDRRRLTILVTNLDRGGAETQAVRLALGLRERGWDVRLLSLLPPRDFVEALVAAGVPVAGLGLSGIASLPGALFRLRRELRRHRPDVLAAFTYHANVAGKVVGRTAGVPRVVASIRSEHFGGRFRDLVERITGPLADVTTVVSPSVGEGLVARGVASARRLMVVPSAVAPPAELAPDERDALRREMGASGDGPLWLAVGRLEEAKDYPNLLAAFARHAEACAGARLAIIGYGALEAEVRAGAAALGDRVAVLGRRDDAVRYISACDAYVLSSAWEGMPNTVLEAMSAGRPVVSTRVGGVPELIEDGASGLLAPPRDPEALAAAMSRMSELSEDERAALGRRGREIVAARHGLEAVLDRWEAVLRGSGGAHG